MENQYTILEMDGKSMDNAGTRWEMMGNPWTINQTNNQTNQSEMI